MRQSLLLWSIILAGLSGLLGYGWVLIDWYQDMQLAHYEREPMNLIVESLVVVAYGYLAFRFLQPQLKRIQESDNFLPGVIKSNPKPQASLENEF